MLRFILFPFSFIFGVITFIRNMLYDWKFVPSVQYGDIFVISVGNITVGGTGKTPFTEYLVRALSQKYCVAVLSHGYKRKTKGFRLVENNATPAETGDESYLVKRKFPEITVAVDADKVNGIARIREAFPDTQVIILDDAFQYRRIRPNLSILLADCNRPMYSDGIMPGGRLREWRCFAKRADIMIITKAPAGMTAGEKQNIQRRYARIFPNDIFFSSIGYGEPLALFPAGKPLSTADLAKHDVLLVTGIASPKPFEDYIRQHAASVQTAIFPDHHAFSENDIIRIAEKLNDNKILITTEKDAIRLQHVKTPETVEKCSYYVPIEINFV